MLWVYVVWTILQGTVQVLLSSVTNGDMTFGRILMLWEPIAQFWFLPALVSMTALVVAIHPWGTGARRARVAVLLVPAVALWGAAPNVAGLRGISLVLFVGAGAALGLHGFGRLTSLSSKLWLAIGGGSLVVFLLTIQWPVVPATLWEPTSVLARVASVSSAAVGTVMLISVAMLLSRVPRVGGVLASIGQQTMPIYLMHILILAGVRVVMEQAGASAGTILAVAVVLAVAVPWAVGAHAVMLRLEWLFVPPRRARKALLVPTA